MHGGLRISNLSLSIDPATGAVSFSPIVTELRTDTFHHWLEISREACDVAASARECGVSADLDDNETFNRAIEQEFRASMTAVRASAFAPDAFYASVVEHAPEARFEANSRDAAIFESLKRAFRLSDSRQTALREPLRVVYRLRDKAVHPPASWAAPVAQPVYGLRTEPRLVEFRVENAINARLLIHKLIYVCMRCPKPRHAELVEWCETHRGLVPEPEPPPE